MVLVLSRSEQAQATMLSILREFAHILLILEEKEEEEDHTDGARTSEVHSSSQENCLSAAIADSVALSHSR